MFDQETRRNHARAIVHPTRLPELAHSRVDERIAGAPLLPDPRLVLAPDLKPLGLGVRLGDLAQAGCKAPFLKACCAFSSVCGWRGRVLRCDRSNDHNSRSIPVSL